MLNKIDNQNYTRTTENVINYNYDQLINQRYQYQKSLNELNALIQELEDAGAITKTQEMANDQAAAAALLAQNTVQEKV